MPRNYFCQGADVLQVETELDNDNQLMFSTFDASQPNIISVKVWLNQEQLRNLYELLGNILGPAAPSTSLWQDV